MNLSGWSNWQYKGNRRRRPEPKESIMINETIERLPPDILQGFRNLLRHDSITCAISHCMGRFNAMTSDMKPLFEGIRLTGSAVTVKTLASDLAAAFKAIDICRPGDIVVIDSHESINTAFWGENMTMSALNRGVIAAVIDGACRDVEEIRKIRFPVICGNCSECGFDLRLWRRQRLDPVRRGGGVARRRRGCRWQRGGCRTNGTGSRDSGAGRASAGDGASSSGEDQGGCNYRRVGQRG